jgi:hypothetical protein
VEALAIALEAGPLDEEEEKNSRVMFFDPSPL